jgi:Integrase zinc binding domain
MELANYHIQLVYKLGAVNRADALSRRPDLVPEEDNELVIVLPYHLFVAPNVPATRYTATRTKPEDYKSDETLVESDNEEQGMKAQTAQMGDSTYSTYELDELVMKAQEIDKRTIQQWRMGHKLSKQGALWTKNGALIVVGNNDLKRGVISLFHDPPMAGHPGIAKTMTLAAQHYWWPGMKDFVTAYVKGCANCQMSKSIGIPTNRPCSPSPRYLTHSHSKPLPWISSSNYPCQKGLT